MRLVRTTGMRALLAAVIVLYGASYSMVGAAGVDRAVLPVSVLTNVTTFGVATRTASVYVAMPDGLYWSTDPALHAWRHMNTLAHINLVAPNAAVPADVVFTTDTGIFRSTDGGLTSVREFPCQFSGLVRVASAPSTLYAATAAYQQCPVVFQAMPADRLGGIQVVLKSVDDGRHWATIYRPSGTYAPDVSYYPMAVDPSDANHVLVGSFAPDIRTYQTVETRDGGKTWTYGHATFVQYAGPSAIAFDPRHPDNAWVAWSNPCRTELDHNQHEQPSTNAPKGAILNLAFDPVNGQLYLRYAVTCPIPTSARIYRLDTATLTYTPIASPPLGSTLMSTFLAITPNGILLTATAGSRLVMVNVSKYRN